MHLLNTSTLKLKYFVTDVPQYVILSHTWVKEEVTFEVMGKPDAENMAGYKKIQGCCKRAREDGYEWVWIDTCCIDKRSSAELSEAINSMYDWYWNAEICYAYLSDFSDCSDLDLRRLEFKSSRWFSRGWTLQELLAPAVVEFYDREWKHVGTKSSLIDLIAETTQIKRQYILDRQSIESASIGARFSWASRRHTTRQEDMAYCLLGLVQVNMPLLYGEGMRAFYRLQLEVLKQTRDHTIFAWDPHADNHGHQTRPHLGILSPSPELYKQQYIASIRPWILKEDDRNTTHEMTNLGLRIRLPCIRDPKVKDEVIAILNCRDHEEKLTGIRLRKLKNQRYERVRASCLRGIHESELSKANSTNLYILAANWNKEEVNTKRKYDSCRLAIRGLHTDHPDKGQVRGTEELQVFPASNYITLHPELREFTPPYIDLGPRTCGTIGIMVDATGIVIIFACVEGRPWLKIVPFDSKETLINVLEKSKPGLDCGEWAFFRDHVVQKLESNIHVEISAKKSCERSLNQLQWALDIIIKKID